MRRPGRLLLILLALAFCLRVARCLVAGIVDRDALLYIAMAEGIAAGRADAAFALNPRMPPLYTLLMAGGNILGLDAGFAGLLISVVAGAVLVIPVTLIGIRLFGHTPGAIGGFLVATHPYLIRVSADILRDSLFLALLFLFAWLVVEAADTQPRRWRLWLLAGICAGLATATRSEGQVAPLALLLWLGVEFFLGIAAPALRKLGVPLGEGIDGEADDEGVGKTAGRLAASSALVAFLFLAAFVAVWTGVEFSLRGTTSEWRMFDPRAVIFIKGLFSITETL